MLILPTYSILFFSAEAEITGYILGADWSLKAGLWFYAIARSWLVAQLWSAYLQDNKQQRDFMLSVCALLPFLASLKPVNYRCKCFVQQVSRTSTFIIMVNMSLKLNDKYVFVIALQNNKQLTFKNHYIQNCRTVTTMINMIICSSVTAMF